MAWLLFLDESGHDHKQMPYEVRGGVALHAGEVCARPVHATMSAKKRRQRFRGHPRATPRPSLHC